MWVSNQKYDCFFSSSFSIGDQISDKVSKDIIRNPNYKSIISNIGKTFLNVSFFLLNWVLLVFILSTYWIEINFRRTNYFLLDIYFSGKCTPILSRLNWISIFLLRKSDFLRKINIILKFNSWKNNCKILSDLFWSNFVKNLRLCLERNCYSI